jgi:hypothetical protein
VFIKKECVVRLSALEMGESFSHLHTQMVNKFHISSLKMLNKVLHEQVGCDDPKKALDEHVVHYKQLRNTSFYTFVSIVGY